ncbi:MAG TPA: hypothetical protein VNG51_05975 [Ktedonobacteraceae bacterium]|nr:hypothetical protein [Ktedonobacteraceae bacterium]
MIEDVSLFGKFYIHSRAVAKDFGDTLGNFGGVVTHADDAVGTNLLRVLDH